MCRCKRRPAVSQVSQASEVDCAEGYALKADQHLSTLPAHLLPQLPRADSVHVDILECLPHAAGAHGCSLVASKSHRQCGHFDR